MSRTRVSHAYIVNWLHYPGLTVKFDGPVVQFHGRNGAGKTTAMAAVVAPLVPHVAKLDQIFRVSGSYQGLRDRVGLNDNPSYAVLRFVQDGRDDVFAGVEFVRHAGANGGVTSTTFVAHGIPEHIPTSAWLLGQDPSGSRVQSLGDLRRAVLLAGGVIKVCGSLSEYYSVLHEHGVLSRPLRDPDDQDRFARIYLSGFGSDTSDLVFRLREYFLPRESQLGEGVIALDSAFAEIVRVRKAIADYEERRRLLDSVWGHGVELVRSAWANDEVAWRAATAQRETAAQKLQTASLDLASFKSALERLDHERVALSNRLRDADQSVNAVMTTFADHLATLEARSADEARDRALQNDMKTLSDHVARPLQTSTEVTQVEEQLRHNLAAAQKRSLELDLKLADLEGQAEALAAGHPDADGQGEATLLALHPAFDDMGPGAAARIEAQLGPAAAAIIDDDPEGAARSWLESGADVRHFWAIAPREAARIAELDQGGPKNGALAHESPFVRASRLPNRPALGRRARAGAAQELRDEAAKLRKRRTDLDGAAERLRALHDAAVRVAASADRMFLPYVAGDALSLRVSTLKSARQAVLDGEALDLMQLAEDDRHMTQALASAHTDRQLRNQEKSRLDSLYGGTQVQITTAEKAEDQRRTELQAEDEALLRSDARRGAWFEAAAGERLLGWIGSEDVLAEVQSKVRVDQLSGEIRTTLERLRQQVESESRLTAGLADVGKTFAEQLRAATADPTAEVCVAIWRTVRHIAASFIPPELTGTDDPMRAAEALASRTAELRETLDKSERVFRLQTANLRSTIVSAIDTHRLRIKGLSRRREVVAFGDFTGVQIKVEPRDAELTLLDDVLTAIAAHDNYEGFMAAVEAVLLDMRKVRGRLSLEADGITDYRNFADLKVLVRRGDGPFVSLAQSGPSTGERIGVLFHTLLMVLEAWEQRQEALGFAGGPLRFLVFDEASRLDARGLATIASFAEAANAQVLIAAPQEQPIEGQSTAYTFVRTSGGAVTDVSRTLVRGRTLDRTGESL